MGFPGSSFAKESACNSGDSSSIPGSGRSAEKGIVYTLQYSGASLMAQLVKSPLAIWETWVRFLGWEDPLEKGMATHILIALFFFIFNFFFTGSSDFNILCKN